MLLLVAQRFFTVVRVVVHGYMSLTLFELLIRIFCVSFFLFQLDFWAELVNFTIKAGVIAGACRFPEKSLLVFNTFLGSAMLVFSVTYLVGWLPNIFRLFYNRR